MLIIAAQTIALLTSFLIFASTLSPLNVVLIYSIFRPLLQPFAIMQYKLAGLPISTSITLAIIFVGTTCIVFRKNWRFIPDKGLLLSIVILLAFISAVFSSDYRESATGIAKLLTIWFIFNMAYNSVNTMEDARKLLFALVIGAMIPLAMGFYQAITGNYQMLHSQTGAVDRINGVFGIGNAYGIYLSSITAASAILLIDSVGRRKKILMAGLLGAVLTSQVLALNRGTWIALIIGFIVAAVKYRRFIKLHWIALGALIMALFFVDIIAERFDDLGNRDNYYQRNTFEGRIEHWKEILALIENKPIIGYGVGTSEVVTTKLLGQSMAPHNDYILIALEMGLIAALLYFLFLLRIAAYFVFRPIVPELWIYNFSLIMLSIYFIIISSTQNIMFNVINFPLFLTMVAIGIKLDKLYAMQMLNPPHDSHSQKKS
ncbi:MAG: O-antigen ligase family protein [Candidatus Sedimenticola sp. 20ELBAFRAG]